MQRVIQALGAVARLDREVRPRGVTNEERVASEHEPGLVCTGPVDDRECAVLGPMPGRVQRPDDDVAEYDLRSVPERLVRERRFCLAVHAHRHALLEREPPVSGHVIRVRVRLERADEPHVPPLALLEILLDRVRGIDDDHDAGVLVADEIRSASEVVVDELLEEHDPTLATDAAISPEVRSPGWQ